MIAAYFNPYRLRVGILLIAVLVTAVTARPTVSAPTRRKGQRISGVEIWVTRPAQPHDSQGRSLIRADPLPSRHTAVSCGTLPHASHKEQSYRAANHPQRH